MLFGYVHGQGVRWQLIDACSKTASCTRALHQAGDGRIAQLVLDDCVDLGCHTRLASNYCCRRVAVGCEAWRRARGAPGPLVVHISTSDARRGRDAGEGHVDRGGRLRAAPGRRGLRGPIRDTIPNPPRVQRASQLETTRRCASRIIAAAQHRKPKASREEAADTPGGPCQRRRAAPTARAARAKREA